MSKVIFIESRSVHMVELAVAPVKFLQVAYTNVGLSCKLAELSIC